MPNLLILQQLLIPRRSFSQLLIPRYNRCKHFFVILKDRYIDTTNSDHLHQCFNFSLIFDVKVDLRYKVLISTPIMAAIPII